MLTILCGVSCSGKSTWAKDQGQLIVSRDSERLSLFGFYRMGNRKEEDLITKIIEWKISTLLSEGHNVIVDNTSLRKEHINELIKLANEENKPYQVKVFDCPPKEEILKRNQKRFNDSGVLIPENVIHRQIKAYNNVITELDDLKVIW